MENRPPFLNVPHLIEASRPRARTNWLPYAFGGFLLAMLVGTFYSSSSTGGKTLVEVVSMIVTIALISAMSFFSMFTIRKLREGQAQIEAAAELVQLRRWPQAGAMLGQLLSRPMRTPTMRFEALMYLTSVLSRYDRFEEAMLVQDHLLQLPLDGATERAIKLGRAMSLLRQDRLFDADRAISDLRRGEAREQSGGLALVEIYRDVKTGHPAEAIETFDQRLAMMRDQLGIRVADAWSLVGKARDMLSQSSAAQSAVTNATLLTSPVELSRRYPEVADVLAKYRTSAAPDAPVQGRSASVVDPSLAAALVERQDAVTDASANETSAATPSDAGAGEPEAQSTDESNGGAA
jgi:hypothetical protein